MQRFHENDLPGNDGSALNIPLFLLFVILGLAGNLLRLELFFDIQFIFGSIFAMLALQFFGLRWGVPAAGIISMVTYLLWNHPYAIVIMTAEAYVVGLLTRRRRLDLLSADALYWLCIGIPLVFLFYSGVMHLPLYLAGVTSMKQAVNGISNALVARLLFMALAARSRRRQFALQEVLFNALAFAVLAVSLFLMISLGRQDLSDTDRSIRGSLGLAKQRMSANLDSKLAADVKVIAYLARIAASRSLKDVQQSIEQAHAMDEDFLRVGFMDRSATVTAFSPLIDDLGRPHIGRNYADRPFIPHLMRELKPMLTDVEMSRFGTPRPRAGIVVPVIRGGTYAGFTIGVLDLERLGEPLALNAKAQIAQELLFTLVDKNNRIIVSNREGARVMEVFERGEGELQDLGGGISRWIPVNLKKNMSISERWKHSYYISEQPIGSGSSWKLMVEQPIAPLQRKLFEKYAAYFTKIFIVLLITLAVARYLSRGVAASLEQLAEVAAGMPSRLSSAAGVTWPKSMITETHDLIHSFRDMAQVMAIQFHRIRTQNESLEQRISERTRELRESEERFRALIESTSDWIWEVDKNGRYSYASPRIRELLGYEPEEVIGRTPFEFMPPEETGRMAEEFSSRIVARQPFIGVENINLHRDGHRVVLETSGVPIIDADGHVQGYRGIDRDITKRKLAEEEVKRLANELQTILNTVAIGVAYGKERRLVWTNPAFQAIFGYTREEAAGLDARTLYADAGDYERVGREGYALIAAGGVYTTEALSVRKDGGTFWLSLTGRAVNPGDVAAGAIWMMQDITERKRSELELQDKTRQLEALTRNLEGRVEQEIALRRSNEQMLVQQSKLAAMGEMLGAIAHQWRQPLNILGLIIQNLKDAHTFGELNKENIEQTVQKSMSQIRHMSKTIDDFRTFFQPDKERGDFDTMQAVGDVLSLFTAQLSANDIDFRLTCSTHGKSFTRAEDIVPCQEKTVNGFKNEFEHVIMNLVNNAREAIMERRERGGMPEGERGLITFEFRVADGMVVIEVADNGGGIPEDVIGRVFEPYFTTKDPSKGTGLGLYMSSVIVKDHMQGRVSAMNRAQNAVFTIELPRA